MAKRIRLLGVLSREPIYVAVSGGPDSMAALNFLNTAYRTITVVYFNHGTEHGSEAESFVRDYCEQYSLPLICGQATRQKEKSESPEEYWRNMRYCFFESLPLGEIVLAHHLNDQVENWVMTSLHGIPKLIPHRRGRYVRPFLLTRKSELVEWCNDKGIPYLTDPSNQSDQYMRSYVRNNIIPMALNVNPGLAKVVRRQVALEYLKFHDEKAGFDFLQ